MGLMEIRKMNDHICLLNHSNETTEYLVTGSKKAVLNLKMKLFML